MMYQGGKTRRAPAIAHIINSVPGDTYIEPFLGSAAVMAKIDKPNRYEIIGKARNEYKDLLLWRGPSNWNPSMIPPMPEKTTPKKESLAGKSFFDL